MAFCWRYGLAAGKQACFELGASPLPLSLIWRRREKTSILRVLLSFLLDFMRPKLSKRKDLALCHWLRGNCGEINYWKCRALKLPNGRGDLVQSPERHPPQGCRVAPLCPVPLMTGPTHYPTSLPRLSLLKSRQASTVAG